MLNFSKYFMCTLILQIIKQNVKHVQNFINFQANIYRIKKNLFEGI